MKRIVKGLIILFSVFVIVNAGTVYAAEEPSAYDKAWDLIQKYADPDYHLNAYGKSTMTEAQYAEIQQTAQEVIEGCDTQYDKIKAIGLSAFQG